MLNNVKVLLVIMLLVRSYAGEGLQSVDFEDSDSERIGSTAALYGYHGGRETRDWGGVCASGTEQSPIDFKLEEIVTVDGSVLRFNGDQRIPQSTNITNSGHSVKVMLRTQKPITVTGGVFGNKVYEFQQLHFHWGRNVNEGSEHTIEAKQFPLECHLVFYKANSKDPTAERDGIAVLGVQYDIFMKDNQVLDLTMKSVRQITDPGHFIVRPNGVPLRDYLPTDLNTYLSYTGSLTTPPCTEGVTWVVFTDRLTVSKNQMSQFGTVKDELGNAMEYNYRETQPLNGRQVYLFKSSELEKYTENRDM